MSSSSARFRQGNSRVFCSVPITQKKLDGHELASERAGGHRIAYPVTCLFLKMIEASTGSSLNPFSNFTDGIQFILALHGVPFRKLIFLFRRRHLTLITIGRMRLFS